MYLTKRNTIIVGIIVLIIVAFIIYQLFTVDEPPVFDLEVESSIGTTEIGVEFKDVELSNNEDEVEEVIKVDVKGAVINPGVYRMENGERVEDAIAKAGGVTENADLKMINRSLEVYDTMEIIVYTIGEEVINYDQSDASSSYINKKIDINHAPLSELCTLNGIGEAKANSIIKYRNDNGDFNSIEDIMEVSGIGPNIFDGIKDSIVVR